MSGRANPNAERRVDVFRGGSWVDPPAFARVAARFRDAPSLRLNRGLGFRLVEEVEEVHRVNRGGSWFIAPASARVADRYRTAPSYRSNALGFRLVEETSNITNGE